MCMAVEQHECVCVLQEACVVHLGTCPPGKEGGMREIEKKKQQKTTTKKQQHKNKMKRSNCIMTDSRADLKNSKASSPNTPR